MKKYFAEFLGTAISLFFGCAASSIASSFAGTLGVSLSFGLGYLVAYYIIGNISDCDINPATSIARFISKELDLKDFIGYIIAQFIGAFVGIFILSYIITSANIGSIEKAGLGANYFGEYSSVGLTMGGAILVESVLTFVYVLVILRLPKDKINSTLNGFVIAMTLVLIHILGTPLTGASANPARSLAPAILLKGIALKQVWVFILAPIIGSVAAALLNKFVLNDKK